MKTCLVGLLGLAALASLGCRTDPNVAILERELRRQEDQIYRLEDLVDQKCAELEACKRSGGSPSKSSHDRGESASTGPLNGDDLPTLPAIRTPEIKSGKALQEGDLPALFKNSSPSTAPRTAPAEAAPPTAAPRFGAPGAALPPPADRSESKKVLLKDPMQTIRPTASNVNVARIVIVRAHTGGFSLDEKPGDEGVTVMIAPRGAAGEPLDAPAAIQVSLLDEELRGQGPTARVAMWEFTAAEIAKRFRRTSANKGVYLELPWPDKPPQHKRLRVFVRYTTTDGRELEDQHAIEIALPEGQSWSPPSAPQRSLRAAAPAQRLSDGDGQVILTPPQLSGPAEPEARREQGRREESRRPAANDNKPQAARPTWSPYR